MITCPRCKWSGAPLIRNFKGRKSYECEKCQAIFSDKSEMPGRMTMSDPANDMISEGGPVEAPKEEAATHGPPEKKDHFADGFRTGVFDACQGKKPTLKANFATKREPYLDGYIKGYTNGFKEKNQTAMRLQKVEAMVRLGVEVAEQWYDPDVSLYPDSCLDSLRAAVMFHLVSNSKVVGEEEKGKDEERERLIRMVLVAAYQLGRWSGVDQKPMQDAEKVNIISHYLGTIAGHMRTGNMEMARKALVAFADVAVKSNWTSSPADAGQRK